MIVGDSVAKTSGNASGCTFKNDAYETKINDTSFCIYDTAGLNEGEQGHVPHWSAIGALYTLIRKLDDISLLIYCMRGRVKENGKANWNLFNKVICGEKVPIIAVVTGLEHYEHVPDDWWRDEGNKRMFRDCGMEPRAVGCVVSILGKSNEYEELYTESQTKLRGLIKEHYLRRPWNEEKGIWFANIYEKVHTLGCFSRSRVEFSDKMRSLIYNFAEETGMEEKDREKLEGTLLKAEKKFEGGTKKWNFTKGVFK